MLNPTVITLATLPQAKAQDVFNQGAKHILNLTYPAYDEIEKNCQYRTKSGVPCAAGCFVSDEEYAKNPIFQKVIMWESLIAETPEVPADHADLICALQATHDCMAPPRGPLFTSRNRSIIKKNLIRVAIDFGLSTTDLIELT